MLTVVYLLAISSLFTSKLIDELCHYVSGIDITFVCL